MFELLIKIVLLRFVESVWIEDGRILMKEESFIRVIHPLRRLLEGEGKFK